MKHEEDVLDMLLGSQELTPSQFHDRARKSELEPEQRLLLAILESAIRESRLQSNGIDHRASVMKWIAGADCDVPFQLCCEGLGIELDYARPRLLREINKSSAKNWSAAIRLRSDYLPIG